MEADVNEDAKKLAALKEAMRLHREKCQVQHCQGCGSLWCQGVRY
jgi:hypothetical protein